MKNQLNMVRAQKAQKPPQKEIQEKIKQANKIYQSGAGRCFPPSIYTR